jgi:peptidoglycan hydrolase-like protein with peptidoglycan-binding domain
MPWALASTTGKQIVYVKFRAINGMVVGSVQASIDFMPSSVASTTAGMSLSEMKSLLASLEAELQRLESQASLASSSRDLSFGMTGSDVKSLQQFLISRDSGSAARKLKSHGATMNFGSLTKNALIEFQKKVGIAPAFGYFGAITRAWINAEK